MKIDTKKPFIKIYRPFMDTTLLLKIVKKNVFILDNEKWIQWSTLKQFEKHWIKDHEKELTSLSKEYSWLANQFTFFSNEIAMIKNYKKFKNKLSTKNDKQMNNIYKKDNN